jgi:hypothetical protein
MCFIILRRYTDFYDTLATLNSIVRAFLRCFLIVCRYDLFTALTAITQHDFLCDVFRPSSFFSRLYLLPLTLSNCLPCQLHGQGAHSCWFNIPTIFYTMQCLAMTTDRLWISPSLTFFFWNTRGQLPWILTKEMGAQVRSLKEDVWHQLYNTFTRGNIP